MRYGRSRWITATAGTVYEPKEASEAEVAAFQDGQRGATLVSPVSKTGRYSVYRNYQTGQVLFVGEGALTDEQEEEGNWRKVCTGDYIFCLRKMQWIRKRQRTQA